MGNGHSSMHLRVSTGKMMNITATIAGSGGVTGAGIELGIAC